MNLKVWLAVHDIKMKDFAHDLRITPSYLSLIINKHIVPSKIISDRVIQITKGDVVLEYNNKKRAITRRKPRMMCPTCGKCTLLIPPEQLAS